MEELVKILLGITPAIVQLERMLVCFMVAGTAQKSLLVVLSINVKMKDCVFLTSQTDNIDTVAYVHLDLPECTVKQ